MRKKSQKIIWSRSNHSLFENFALGLEEYTRTGKIPSEADQDIQYTLELQNKRLRGKGLSMEYSIVPRGNFATAASAGQMVRSWSDDHYTSRKEGRTCRLERRFFRGTEKEYEKHKKMALWQTITDVNTPQLVEDDVHNCPGCGAVTTINKLQKGCPYCGARFQMSDIFPKVSNYYFFEDASFTDEEYKAYLWKFIIVMGILFFLRMLPYYYFENPDLKGQFIKCLFGALFAGAFGGTILGFLFSVLALFGKALWESARAIPVLSGLGSGIRFSWRMKKYSPDFSYEYFSNKVISLLKMIIFADNPMDLPIYTGDPPGNTFEDIVDVSYIGDNSIGLKKFRIEGDFCFVTVNVFLDNLYEKGNRFFERRDKYCVQLKKNISKPVNMHFSIRHLQCKGCGMSFDATKEKHCPGCGTVYDLETEDWVVTGVERKKIY